MITYWIYTKIGMRIGQFSYSETALAAGLELMSEKKFIEARFRIACLSMNIDHKQHNYCIAAA